MSAVDEDLTLVLREAIAYCAAYDTAIITPVSVAEAGQAYAWLAEAHTNGMSARAARDEARRFFRYEAVVAADMALCEARS